MKGTKTQNGITLIALIITIIVLLILAVVAISAIQDSGILIHVDRSAIMYEVGTISEKIRLESQALKLAGALSPDNAIAQTGGNALKSLYARYDNVEYDTVELKTIKLDKNGTESIPEITDFTKEYHVVIPEKLNYDISRGKEVDNDPITEDIFVVDNDFNVYYLITLEEQTTIIPDPPIDEIPEDLETYILGEADADGNRPGKQFLYDSSTEEGIFNAEGGMIFVSQTDTLVANGGVTFVNLDNQTFTVTITYAGDTYLFNVNIEENNNGITYNLRKLIVKELNAEGKIEAIEDLVDFTMTVNNGNNLAGKTITLEKSLDFTKDEDYKNPMDTTYGDINGNGNDQEGIKAELTTGTGFLPIGTLNMANMQTIPFSGNFDGKGNTISNLYINNQGIISAGLFGVVGTEGNTIKDLTLVNPVVNNAYYFTGGIIGHADGSNSLNIDNCHVIGNGTTSIVGSVTGGVVAGGIIGEVGAFQGNENQTITITDCTVKNQTIAGGSKVAGIIGGANVGDLIVSDCIVENTNITATGADGETIAAGIAIGNDFIRDGMYDTDMTITSCSTVGTTTITSTEYVSGIAAYRNGRVMKIEKCTNGAALSGGNMNKTTWFLCGEVLRPGGSMEVTDDCVNNGTLADTTLDSTVIQNTYVYNDTRD